MEPENPPYKCPICKDTFWRQERDSDGNSICYECECLKVRKAQMRIEKSGLADEIKEKTFKNFKTDTDWQRDMKKTALAYGKAYFDVKENGGKFPWFFVAGNPGCGKTHLCTALCGALLNRGVPVSYMQWVTESRKLRGYAFEQEVFESIIEPYIDIDVLYIDDLFKQPAHKEINVSDAEGKILFEILNQRYIQNKATIISTEWYMDDDELMRFDGATFSRVVERCGDWRFVLNIERGPDKNYRLFKRNVKKKEGD